MWIFIKYDKLIQWLAYLSFWRKICKPNGYTFHPFRGMILVGGATTLVRYNDTSYNGLQLGLNLCVKMTKLNLTLPFSKPFSVTRWWNKKLPNFPRYCPKSIQIIFLPETCIIWNSPKRVPKYLGYFYKIVQSCHTEALPGHFKQALKVKTSLITPNIVAPYSERRRWAWCHEQDVIVVNIQVTTSKLVMQEHLPTTKTIADVWSANAMAVY